MTAEAYFTTVDGTWFEPNDLARGPWDPGSCHAGPPTSLVIRALEGLGLDHQLTRLTMSLHRPVPMAGFSVTAEVARAGRMVATTTATISDGDGRICATASALHIMPMETPTITAPITPPVLADAVPGPFPIPTDRHGDMRLFSHSMEVRYDPHTSAGPGVARDDLRPDVARDDLGPATMWMRTVPIVAGETPSPLQRLGPLADCANGISFNVSVDELTCVNPDLTVTILRLPMGEWFASRAATHASNDGIGFSDAHLFDEQGLVGRVTQSLVLRAV